jgi:hypothetical protein
MKPWPKVSLGDLLRLERRPARVEPEKIYQEIGIYCFGRGIFHKTPRGGFEVGEKDLFLMKEGDFILQVTFAWEGAVAIVSAAEDGMYGSTRYPTFLLQFQAGQKEVLPRRPHLPIQRANGCHQFGILQSPIAQELPSPGPVLLFHMGVVVGVIGARASKFHPNFPVPHVGPQMMVEKLAPVVRIESE